MTTAESTTRRLGAGFEQGTRRTHHLIGPDRVDRVDALEIFRGQAIEIVMRHMLGHAGIVDQRIEPPPVLGGRDDVLAILVLRYVALNHDDFGCTRIAAQLGSGFGFLLTRRIVDDNTGAVLGENGGGRSTKPRCRPCNHDAQTVTCHLHFLCLF